MPRLGIGMPLVAMATEAAVLTVDDFFWDIALDPSTLSPLDTSGTLNDTSNIWDYDGTNIMPEVDPDSEGVWERPANLIKNHDFSNDSEWSKTGSASISGGKGTVSGSGGTSLLFQDTLVNGNVYEITYTISNFSKSSGQTSIINSDGNQIQGLNQDGDAIQAIVGNGTFTFIFKHTIDNGNLIFRASNGTNAYQVDNVVLKEYEIKPLAF